MTKNQEFLKAYKNFESWAKDHFPKLTDMNYLENNYSLEGYRNRLSFFRKVRNVMTHDGYIGNTPLDDMLSVSDDMLKEFKSMTEEIKTPAKKLAIKYSDIYAQSLDDNVVQAIKHMNKHTYTHIPILKNKRVIGLFGENSLFEIASSGFIINNQTCFHDLLKFIEIDKVMRTHLVCTLGEDATLLECKQQFAYAITKRFRRDIILITHNGKIDGQLKGLITIWDLPGMGNIHTKK